MKKFKEYLNEKATFEYGSIYEPKKIKDIKTYENPEVLVHSVARYNLDTVTNMITKKLIELAKEAKMLENDAKKDAKFFRHASYKSLFDKIDGNLKHFVGAMADIESQMSTPQWKAKGTKLGSKKYK